MSEESIKDRVSTVMRMAGNLLSDSTYLQDTVEDDYIERAVRRAWKVHDETLRQNEQRRQQAIEDAAAIGRKALHFDPR